jgi:hypothetical protein
VAKDELVVYWSPSAFSLENESWNLLYPEPVRIREKFQAIGTSFKRGLLACPATKKQWKNMFALVSAVDDDIDLPVEYLKETALLEGNEQVPSANKQTVSLFRHRVSSFEGYSNLLYNLSWVFVAEEPLIMEFFPPYLPPSSPSPNSILASGEFDIGQWFRPTSLDYHVPFNNSYFRVNTGDELAYVRFKTDKKVVLKRFIMNQPLVNLYTEMSTVSGRYNANKTLFQRYEMAKKSKIMNIVIKQVKDNLV